VGKLSFRRYDTVGLGNAFTWITQNGIVQRKGLGKLLVLVFGIAARGKVDNVELSDLIAALTERLAFSRSSTGESFGKPSNDYGFAR
jgi:hypothetical protein